MSLVSTHVPDGDGHDAREKQHNVIRIGPVGRGRVVVSSLAWPERLPVIVTDTEPMPRPYATERLESARAALGILSGLAFTFLAVTAVGIVTAAVNGLLP